MGATVEAESQEEADAVTDRIWVQVVTVGWMGEFTHRQATDWMRASEDEPSHSWGFTATLGGRTSPLSCHIRNPEAQGLAQGTDPGPTRSVPTGEDSAGREGRAAAGAACW